jgi:hypothetical protein
VPSHRLEAMLIDRTGGGFAERFPDQPAEVAFFLALHVNSAVAKRDC